MQDILSKSDVQSYPAEYTLHLCWQYSEKKKLIKNIFNIKNRKNEFQCACRSFTHNAPTVLQSGIYLDHKQSIFPNLSSHPCKISVSSWLLRFWYLGEILTRMCRDLERLKNHRNIPAILVITSCHSWQEIGNLTRILPIYKYTNIMARSLQSLGSLGKILPISVR